MTDKTVRQRVEDLLKDHAHTLAHYEAQRGAPMSTEWWNIHRDLVHWGNDLRKLAAALDEQGAP